MGNIKNWDDIQESSYINQEGRYTLKVIEATKGEDGRYTQTTANGKEFHKYVCSTKEGDKIAVTLWLSDAALWRYKKFASACGVPTTGNVDFDILPGSIVGRKFIADVKKQPDKTDIVTGEVKESKFYEVSAFFEYKE